MLRRFMYVVNEAQWAIAITEFGNINLSAEDRQKILDSSSMSNFTVTITGERAKDIISEPDYFITSQDGKPIGIDALTEDERTLILEECIQHFKGFPLDDNQRMPYAVTEIYEIINWKALERV